MAIQLSGSEFLVNTTTLGVQSDSALTVLADGRFIIVWTDSSQTPPDTSVSQIRARFVSATGQPLGTDFTINATTAGEQGAPSVAALPNGGFVVTWFGFSPTNYDIFSRTFNASGQALSGDVLVNTTTSDFQHGPVIAVQPDGRYLVAYYSQTDSSGGDVRGRLFNAAGEPAGPDFLINSSTAGNQTNATAAALANGQFVVAWFDSIGDGSGTSVSARILNADGSGEQVGFLANSVVSGDQSQPNVAALAGGGFVIVWTDASGLTGDTSGSGIAGQVFASDGSRVGSQFRVNTTTQGNQNLPNVLGLGDGGFLVSWTDQSTDGGNIKGQLFDAMGSQNGAEFTLNQVSTGRQDESALIRSPGGKVIVTFTDESQTSSDVSGSAVRAQVLLTASPVITSNGGGETAAVSIGENTTFVTTVNAIHLDPTQTVTAYGIVGENQSLFEFRNGNELHFVSPPNFENLPNAGATPGYQVQILVADANGAVDSQLITVQVTDVAEAPTAVDDAPASAVVEEGLSVVSGNVLINDTAGDSGPLTVVTVSGALGTINFSGGTATIGGNYGSLTINSDGSYIYTLNNAAVQGYGTGQTLSDTFTYGVTDSEGSQAETSATLHVEVQATTPTVADDLSTPVVEDGAQTSSGNVLANDAAFGTGALQVATLSGAMGAANVNGTTATIGGNYGSLTISADGSYTYTLNNDAVQGYGAGQTLSDIFTYGATDSPGSSAETSATLRIEVQGTTPTLADDVSTPVVEDGVQTAVGNVLTNDTGHDGAALSVVTLSGALGTVNLNGDTATIAGNYGSLTINADGSYTYTLNNAAVQPYGAGQTLFDTFFYGVTDGPAGSASEISARLDIEIHGADEPAPNGAPSALNLSTTSVEEFRANGTIVGTLSTVDPDSGDTFTYELLDDAGGRFYIAGGDLRVANGLLVDFEQATSHQVQIRSTDSGGLTHTQSVTISIINVDPESVIGDEQANTIVGGALNDQLYGGGGDDTLVGGAGIDFLDGGAGEDTMSGGAGVDQYHIDDVGDVVVELLNEGHDVVVSEIDYTLGANVENLSLTFGARIGIGNELPNNISGQQFGDYTLYGEGGNDILHVSSGTIYGGEGKDRLDAFGDSLLIGGAGDDTYVGDSTNEIVELANEGNDTAIINSGDYTLVANVENLTLIFDATSGWGNELDNVISVGNNSAPQHHYLHGLAGADTLVGGWGRNTLDGGSGNDLLVMGIYDVNTVIGGAGIDTARFEYASLTAASFSLDEGGFRWRVIAQGTMANAQDGDHFFETTEIVTGTDPDGSGLLTGRFLLVGGGGFASVDEALTAAQLGDTILYPTDTGLASLVFGTNHAPAVAVEVPDQTASEDAAFSYVLPANVFTDADVGDTLTLSASGLPGWLTFDAASGTFSGTPRNADVGAATVTLTATDAAGATAAQDIVFTVTDINNAPAGAPTASLADGTEDADYTVSASTLLAGFTDLDGDTLSVQNLAASNGTVTDNGDGSFAVTPTANFNGAVTLTYDITDGHGGTLAGQTLSYILASVNDAPTWTGLLSLVVTEDSGIAALDLIEGASDVDDAVLTVESLRSVSPGFTSSGSTLFIDTGSAAFQLLGQNVEQPYLLDYFVADEHGARVRRVASITITGVNDDATITGVATGVVAEDGSVAVGAQLTVADPDDNQSRFATPASLAGSYGTFSFDAASGVWGYALSNASSAVQGLKGGQVAHDTLTVASLDGTASSTIDVTVTGANDAPSGAPTATLASGTEDTTYALSAATLLQGFTDVDGDTLAIANLVASNGAAVATVAGGFSIAPAANFNGAVTLTYDVVDGGGGVRAGQTRTLTFNAVNDAAVIAGVAAGTVTEDSVLAAAGTLSITDVDAGQNRFAAPASLAGTYGTFTFNAVTGAWGYMLNNASAAVQALNTGDVRHDLLTVTSIDGSATKVIDVTINGVNDTVVISNGNGSGTLNGTAGSDIIDAAGGTDIINAGAGDDRIAGGAGSDIVLAGAGNDTIIATRGDGSDLYDGGTGSDTLDYSAITAPLTIVLDGIAQSSQTGIDLLSSIENGIGGSGNDQIRGTSANNVLSGGAGADTISGQGGADTINGGDGNDTLSGDDGNDTLDGGIGADTLNGGAGGDRLIGGVGNDLLNGGAGNDAFVFKAGFGADRIQDFDANPSGGQDLLDLTAYGFTAATFAQHVVIADVGADTLVTIDHTDTIRLLGIANATTVTSADFLLA